MRLRLPELLREYNYTAYAVARDSGGRISLSTIYRLKRSRGRLEFYGARLCDAIVFVLGITDVNELFEFDARPARKAPPKPGRQRRRKK